MSGTLNQEQRNGYQKVSWGPRDQYIPTDWGFKKLGDISKKIIYPQRDKPENLDGEIPWVRIEDLDGKYISESKSGKGVSKETVEEMNLSTFPSGTLMCSCSGNMGICAITERELVSNQTFAGIVPSKDINVEYLYYILESMKDDLQRMSTGTTISYLSSDKLKKFSIPCPPRPEQRRIADILSMVDKQIQQTEEMIKKTEDLKRGLMQNFFSGTDSEKTREVRFGSNLSTIPAAWKVTTLSQVCEKIVDGPHSTPDYTDTGIPFVSAGDIENGEIDFENSKRLSKEDDEELRPRVDPQAGDILLGKVGSGSLGKVCIVDTDRRFNIFVQLALLRPKIETILPGYLGTALQYRQMQQQILDNASGASMQYIGTGAIGNLEIPLPTIEEQKEISEGFGYIRQKIRQERKYKSELQELKRGLMQDLLTGKVRVDAD